MTAAWMLLLIVFAPDRSLQTMALTTPSEAACKAAGEAFKRGEPRDIVTGQLIAAGSRTWACIHVIAPGHGA